MSQQPEEEKTYDLMYTIPIPGRDERFPVVLRAIPASLLWRVYTIRQTLGPEALFELLHLAELVATSLQAVQEKFPDVDIQRLFLEFWTQFPDVVPMPKGTDRERRGRPPKDTDRDVNRVLAISYTLLRDRAISHADAAKMASSILGREINQDTWRRRVDRWAKAHGLPKVDLKRTRT
jgi:hypothetical protein